MTRILALLCGGGVAVRRGVGGVNPGSISGYVRNTAGVPQMGATVAVG